MAEKKLRILIAEDNEADRNLLRRAATAAEVDHELWFVGDGEELLSFLRREGQHESMRDEPMPDLLILDINMPRMDGMQALEQIKADPVLGDLPVLMLTSSNRDEDMIKAYTLDVSGYINKTGSFGSLIEIMKAIGE